jgi:DNA polymerase-3 subunit delta'
MTGIESIGLKFYIISGIEQATPQAINSLLKFLEEPFSKIFAILTTRSLNLVLPTIRSRTQTFILKSKIEEFTKNLENYKLDQQQMNVIKNIYYSYDEIINDLKNNDFYFIYDLAISFKKNIDDIFIIKKIQEQFSKLNYSQISLLIKIIGIFFPNNIRLINLIETIHNNPVKILLFNKVWSIIQEAT